MKLGEFLKAWRKENKVTQEELAISAGVTKGYVSQLENDYKPNGKDSIIPTYTVLKGFAKAMNMDINTFLNSVDTEISLVKEDPEVAVSKPVFPDFNTPQEAVRFLLEQPMIADFGGYDLSTMSDEQIIDFANEIAGMIQFAATHHYAKRKE